MNFTNNIISFIYAKKHIKFNFKHIKFKKYIKPLTMILIITNIDLLYSQLDRVMLGKFVNGVAVSMYYIPYYIVSTLAAVPYSIINVSIPRLSYLVANESKEVYKNSLNKIISSLLFVIIPMCFGVLVLSYEVIYLYAGDKYIGCVIPLIVACITRIIISVESVFTNLIMYPNNQEKKILTYSLSCGILNLILNAILVYLKVFTPTTAMVTTLIAEVILIFVYSVYVTKKLKFKPDIFSKQNLTYLLLGILFIPISLIVRLLNLNFYFNIAIIIILCVALYGTILLIKKDENIILIKNKILSTLKLKFVKEG